MPPEFPNLPLIQEFCMYLPDMYRMYVQDLFL